MATARSHCHILTVATTPVVHRFEMELSQSPPELDVVQNASPTLSGHRPTAQTSDCGRARGLLPIVSCAPPQRQAPRRHEDQHDLLQRRDSK